MQTRTRTGSPRLGFLDWTRGAAAIVMLQGHVFHSFLDKGQREGSPYVLSQFVGGMTPAIFLFLTGVTLAFLMDSRARKGDAPATRVKLALRRAGYLLLVAILFRVQLWVFATGQSPLLALFRVDILNCMALGIAVLAPLAIFETIDRVRFGAVSGLAIAAAAPVVRLIDWSGVHPYIRNYFVPNAEFFAFFPWAAFIAFGLSLGSIMRLVKEPDMLRVMQWGALAGFGLILAARYFADLPYSLYPATEFWVDSPALILIKLGVILVLLAFAFLWTRYAAPQGFSWVRQLGTTSLLVYWVHTELVYGRWMGGWKESLSAPATAALAAVMIALMVGLSWLRTNWQDTRRYLGWPGRVAPSEAAGD